VRVLGGDFDADARCGVALVRQRGQPQRSRPVQRRQGVGARGGDVVGRAGLHRSGPHRKTSVIGQDLHVAAKGPVLTGVPQVVAGLGASGDPVSADQGPVQADERLAVPAEPVQDVGDLGGSLGDHLQGLVQVAVAGGLRDPGVAGQGPHIGALLEPPQHQDGLTPGRAGPLMRADVVGATVSGQPAADGAHSGDGDVESGTIGQHAEPFLRAGFLGRKQLCRTAPRASAPTHPTPARPTLPRHHNTHGTSTITPDEKTSFVDDIESVASGVQATSSMFSDTDSTVADGAAAFMRGA